MDRDRRPRDIPPEDQFGNGRGQSYRPGKGRERTPPRMDSYRGRSPLPPRRSDYMDSYRGPRNRSRSPPFALPIRDGFRRRSPSPRFREHDLRGGDGYRAGPPRREELPRDDLFRREPVREPREFQRGFRDDIRDRGFHLPSRSPIPRFRDRSPLSLNKRGREISPISSRGRRSPPPARRERLVSPPRPRHDEFPQSRIASPPPRRRFSPPPRERHISPPRNIARDLRPRSPSPTPRVDRTDVRPTEDRRRHVSPPLRESRLDYPIREGSGYNSTTTSRRSSPPIHPSRAGLQHVVNEERVLPSKGSPRRDIHEIRPMAQSVPTEPRKQMNETQHHETQNQQQIQRLSSLAPQAQAHPQRMAQSNQQERDRDPVRKQDSAEPSAAGADLSSSIPESRRPEEAPSVTPRAPPTGPAGQRHPPASANPPTGPSAGASSRSSAVPPSGPRGTPSARGDYSSRGRGGFGAEYTPRGRGSSFGLSYRGGRGGTPPTSNFGRGDKFQPEPAPFGRGAAPPLGPRATSIPSGPAASFRQSVGAASSPFTRSQRFGPNGEPIAEPTSTGPPTGPKATRRIVEPAATGPHSLINRPHPALVDLPQIVEGGKKLEPLVDRTKVVALEEEAEKLRRQLGEKEIRNRKSLREWDRLTRETELAALRSELADNSLRQLNGEVEMQAAF
ncbi:uncharacterized protein K489DRAFT_397701 [Dissoconium aciculare CBS 342.82]|uniref:Uncharacterized protein n=1 Tax=Dissoconium aciculare CBS 342.82 TaxID=1314786 RepID=A0A6J3MHR5_9PEZI|nr:uncharacterized protein K489DRAFT_397701 [Dissoconium aciculare CBS 342.82]KAF1827423.1 hypothetical protein K489DRAFT_397701 [Dissoconium aciculare CBS 342.82]